MHERLKSPDEKERFGQMGFLALEKADSLATEVVGIPCISFVVAAEVWNWTLLRIIKTEGQKSNLLSLCDAKTLISRLCTDRKDCFVQMLAHDSFPMSTFAFIAP